MIGSSIELKGSTAQARMIRAGELLAQVHDAVRAVVEPGVTTGEIDRVAADAIRAADSKPSFLNYRGFPATVCASVNEEIVHGIPGPRKLVEGDIVGVDIGLIHEGYHADRATTYPVGQVDPDTALLLRVTMQCLDRAVEACRAGNRLSDIAEAVQSHAEAHGLGVVREFSGHGIGRNLHEPPQVPNCVPPGGWTGGNPRLRAGMALAIEPMINLGSWKTRTLADKWTVVTADGSPSAHFEHTVIIGDGGPIVTTGLQPSAQELKLDTGT